MITGIQQIGIGVTDIRQSMLWYKDHFGMDVLVFDDTSEALLMTQYTGGKVHERRAILSMNLEGGGGFEIWQFNDRTPAALPEILYGDIGIYAAKIKCADVAKAHDYYKSINGDNVSDILKDAKGEDYFFVKDPYGNRFQIVNGNHWFQRTEKITGGVCGAVIGVTDMETSLNYYRNVLGIKEVVYDEMLVSKSEDGATNLCRKVLLQKHPTGRGAFNKLLGSVEIELVQALDRKPEKIYDNRYWGDCGFIHLCFDVIDMNGLKAHAKKQDYNFAVDSNESYAMENAAGRFCYSEDPDGTLIELVETHKVPIYKKMGWYIDLKKRNMEKPLPDWMIKMLALSKVK